MNRYSSITLSIKNQDAPERFVDDLFQAMKQLDDKLTELRVDIVKLSESPRQDELQTLLQDEQQTLLQAEQHESLRQEEQHEAPARIDPIVSSMHVAQRFAERVYSKASTVSTTYSEFNPESSKRDVAPYGGMSSPLALLPESDDKTFFKPVARVDLELLQAQKALRLARENYDNGEMKEALAFCSVALEDLNEVENADVEDYIEYITLLKAMIHATIGDSASLTESRQLLETIDSQRLQTRTTDDLVLDRMALICWTKFKLLGFEEAGTLCRILIRDARDWSGDENNDRLYDAIELSALLQYCQNRKSKGQSRARIIPLEYLLTKVQQCGQGV